MPSSTSRESVAKLYVATFNRAPDAAGLDYWVNDSNLELAGIASSFFAQPETQNLYPSDTTNRAFIQAVYQNLFNREPDEAGWDYWEEVLNQKVVTKDTFILAVIGGAESATGSPMDAAVLANKTAVGMYYSDLGLDDPDKAYEVMDGVGVDSQTVDFAKASIDIFADDPKGVDEYLGAVTADSTTAIEVTLEAGKSYTLSVQALNDSSLDPQIAQVTDTTGTVIEGASNNDSGASNSAKVSLSPTVSGTYTVTVAGEEGTSGNFWLGATETDVTENKEVTTLSVGEEHQGHIALSFSEDNYQVSLEAGQTYELQIKQSHGNALDNPTIDSFLDPSGKSISNAEFSSKNGITSLIFTAVEAGNYALNINDKFDDTGRYFVSVSTYDSDRTILTSRSTDDYGSSLTSYGSMSANTTVTGSIGTDGDEDWFQIYLEANHEYEVSLSASSGSSLDTVIDGIYDSSGTYQLNTYNDDGGVGYNSLLTYTPTESGTYYIEADGYGSSLGSYDLTVTDLTQADDYGNTIGSSYGSLSTGILASGSIEDSYDRDWFLIYMDRGAEYEISMQASNDSGLDTVISGIYDSAGYLEDNSYNDDGGTGYNSLLEFTPDASGYYFIEAAGYGSDTGSYSLYVTTTGVSDDYGNNASSSGSLTSGSTTSGSIEESGDVDWFQVYLQSGNEYTFNLNAASSSSLDTIIGGLYDPSTNYIENTYDDDGGEGLNSLLTFTPNQSGYYYIEVDGYGSSIGGYDLTLTGTASNDDYVDSISTTGAVGTSGLATGNIEEAGDSDWFEIQLSAGIEYTVSLSALNSDLDTIIGGIYNASGSVQPYTYNDDGGEGYNSLLTYIPTESGTYYIEADGFGSSVGAYSLQVISTDNDDYGNSESNHGEIGIDETITGAMDNSVDEDWFGSYLFVNNTYQITLTAPELGDSADITIIDSAGHFQYFGISDELTDENGMQLIFQPSESDTYYLQVSDLAGGLGSYSLSLADITLQDDYGNSTTSHGSTSSGSIVTGSIEESGDSDWFQISLAGGMEYEFSLEASADSNLDTIIGGIYDSAGNVMDNTYNDDGGIGYNSLLSWTAESTGSYFVEVTGYGSSIGAYGLTVNSTGASDDIGSSVSSHGSAETGTAQGNIEIGGDRDWFSITLSAGGEYLIDLSASGNSELDTVISGIYDANGVLQDDSFNDDGGTGYNSLLAFTADSTGTYFIEVSGYGESTGSYDLVVSGSETPIIIDNDDQGSSTSSHGTISVGSSVQGEIETGGDQDWFEVSLTSGTTYQVNLMGSPSGQGTLADPYFYGVYDSNGQLIGNTTNDDSNGYESSVTFTATETGNHYLSAGAYSSYTGSYTIQIDEVSEDSGNTTTIEALPENDWTIMIYIAADNDLEPFGLIDLNEMEIANVPDNVNVTFLIDRVNGYDTSNGDWTDTRRGIVESDNSMFTVSSDMESVGELNMGDPQTLADFIDWNTQIAPAENYGLVIWDHGNGINGVAYDETSGHDRLSVSEVSNAISTSSLDTLEFVGFDACLEAVIDQTYVLKDQTDIVIASQDLEPGDGWDYTGWFNSLTTNLTTESIADAAVTSFDDSYANSFQQTTLSAVKTSEMDDIATSLFTFSTELAKVGTSDLNSVKSEVAGLELFVQEYIDIRALAQAVLDQNINGNMNTAASNLINNVDEAVIANEVNNKNDAHGLSIYWPGTANSSYEQNFELAETAGLSTLYDVFFS